MARTVDTVHPEIEHPMFTQIGNKWSWAEPRHGEHFRRCDFCGSVHPEDLVAEENWSASWADRKYGWPHKFYVDIPNRDPGALFVVSSQNFAPRDNERNLRRVADMTDEMKAVLVRDYGKDELKETEMWYGFGTREVHHAKFYTMHLNDIVVPEYVRLKVMQISGLRFFFDEPPGTVKWEPWS